MHIIITVVRDSLKKFTKITRCYKALVEHKILKFIFERSKNDYYSISRLFTKALLLVLIFTHYFQSSHEWITITFFINDGIWNVKEM